MKKICFALLLCCVFLGGCGVSQADFDKINEENAALKSENVSLKQENATILEEKKKLEDELTKISAAEEARRAAEEAKDAADKDKAASKEEAKEKQLVIVEKSGIKVQSRTDKFNYPDLMFAKIKNLFADTIKNYTVSFLAYDKNGFPVQIIGSSDYRGDVLSYEKLGFAIGVNISENETYGDSTGWGISEDNKVAYLIACVKEAEFFGMGNWKNPYYSFFMEEFAEKQVDVEILKNMYK